MIRFVFLLTISATLHTSSAQWGEGERTRNIENETSDLADTTNDSTTEQSPATIIPTTVSVDGCPPGQEFFTVKTCKENTCFLYKSCRLKRRPCDDVQKTCSPDEQCYLRFPDDKLCTSSSAWFCLPVATCQAINPCATHTCASGEHCMTTPDKTNCPREPCPPAAVCANATVNGEDPCNNVTCSPHFACYLLNTGNAGAPFNPVCLPTDPCVYFDCPKAKPFCQSSQPCPEKRCPPVASCNTKKHESTSIDLN